MPKEARLAIVVSPASSGLQGEQGGLDADAVRERLTQPDAAFEVVTLDGSRDIAEQLDNLFDDRDKRERSVLFYASSDVRVAQGEFFLCLDPSAPDTGDALADVASVLADRGTGAILIVLDARYQAREDPAAGAEIVRVARKALKELDQDIELIIGARPQTPDPVTQCSPFTRAILEVLDESDPTAGLNAVEIHEALGERDEVLASLKSFAHLPAEDSFMVIRARDVEINVADEAPPESVTLVSEKEEKEAPKEDETKLEEEQATPVFVAPVIDISGEPPSPSVKAPEAPKSATSSESVGPASVPPRSVPPPAMSFFPPANQPDATALIAEARGLVQKRDFEGALSAYRRALGMGNLTRDVRGHIYLRMGMVKALQEKMAEAIANFEKALTLVGEDDVPRVLGELLTLYLAEKDYRAALATQEKILKLLPSEDRRFDALLRFGKGWLAIPDEKLRARQMLERAERIRPEHRDLLVLLKNLGETEGRVEEVLTLRRRIADATEDPAAKAQEQSELARDLAKRGREEEAVQLYEAALDAHPSRVDPLAGIAALLSERQEWSQLEASYRRMFARLPRVEPAAARDAVEWELSKRLGLLLRDHLDDAKGALEAFERAARARPEDSTVRKLAADAARAADDRDALERHLLMLTVLEPRDARVYRFLFDGYMKAGHLERACDAAAVLVSLGVAADRERVTFEANRATEPPKIAPVDAIGWELLRPASTDAVQKIFEAAGAAMAAGLAEVVATSQAGRLPDAKLKVDPESSTVTAVRALAFASKSMGLTPPVLYLDEKDESAYSLLVADPPASRIGAAALRGKSLPELLFLAGRHLTYHEPEYRLLALCPALEDLTACFLAAVSVVTHEKQGSDALKRVVSELTPRIDSRLDPEAKIALTAAVGAFVEQGARADLTKYVASVERTSLRVGLLLAGDLAVAIAMSREGLFGGGYRDQLSADARVSELYSFSVSNEYSEVRAHALAE